MAKLSANGARPVRAWRSPDGRVRLVLRSDGVLLRGYRAAGGGWDYAVLRRGIEPAEAAAIAARLGHREERP